MNNYEDTMTNRRLTRIASGCAAAALLVTSGSAAVAGQVRNPPARATVAETVAGVPLNTRWKQELYKFAGANLRHSAWGLTHSERDFLLAKQIAAEEGMRVDEDVLFAAGFTHDIGAIGNFQKEGVDHAERSAELVGPLLEKFGFPAEKLSRVRGAILGHMYDKTPRGGNEAVVLHDADTLDFLGAIGIARRLSVTGEADSFSGGVDRIRAFADKLPPRLITATAKKMAPARVAEMRQFLDRLDAQSFGGRLQ